MGYFGETKHKKVLRKSKKQWVTIGLTSAALGITGLVQTGELVSAEEVTSASEEAEHPEAELTESAEDASEEPEEPSEEASKAHSVEELVNTYIEKSAQEDSNPQALQEAFEAELAALGDLVDADAARSQFEEALANKAAEAATEEVGEEVAETPETEDAGETEEVHNEPEEEPVQVAQNTNLHPEQEQVPQAQTRAVAQPQIATFSATRQPQQGATDANLDADLGKTEHVDGRQMEERQVEVRLEQTDTKRRAEEQIRAIRLEAYNQNLPFQFNSYDPVNDQGRAANNIRDAARAVGYDTADEYVNAFEWSDRLEDFAIQRATELLTTGYHSGNKSHARPDGSVATSDIHNYTSEDESVSHNAPESIHAAGSQDIDRAFYAWGQREFDNLKASGGRMVYGGQAETTTHVHQILNPVHTLMGGASVVMNDGSRGNHPNHYVTRANVLISADGTRPERQRDLSGSSPNHSRDGVYHVTVLTPVGSPELPGEFDPNAHVEIPLDFQSDEQFNINAEVGSKSVVQQGRKGLSVNGQTTVQPVDEIVEYGPELNVLDQGPEQKVFNANLPVGTEKTEPGRDGFELIDPLTNTVVKTQAPKATVTTYGPVVQEQDFDTIRQVSFELDLGETDVVEEGQKGVVHLNPLTDEVVKVVNEVVNQVVEVGVEQREVPFETGRVAAVGIDEERVVREGVPGVAYFDENGNPIESDRDMAPINELVEYPAEARPVPFETERRPVVGLESERVLVEGEAGLAYYDEEANLLDVPENTDPVTEVIEYPAEARPVEFETERRPVVGLESERVLVEGEAGLAYYDEEDNLLDVPENTEPVTEIVEYPAEERSVPFETERRPVVGLEAERVSVKGEEGLAYYDEEDNLLDVPENTEPVTEVIEYPAEARPVPFETERRPVVGLESERVLVEGEAGLAYYDEEDNLLDVPENTDPVTEVVEYPAEAQKNNFDTDNTSIDGLEQESLDQVGVQGLQSFNEDNNKLDVTQNRAAVTQVVETPAKAQAVPFETERRPVVGLEEERVLVEGEEGLAYYDEEDNLLDVPENTEPVTEVVEYPAEKHAVPFETIYVESEELPAGQERTVQEGQPGVVYYDEEGNELETPENAEPINEIIEVGTKEVPSQVSKDLETVEVAQVESEAQRNAAHDAAEVIKGLTHLTDEEKELILSAIESANDIDKLDELVEAAYELHLSRQGVEDEEDPDKVEEEVAKAGVGASGQRLPDTATSAWALGLIGMTTLISGLGIKKIKNK